MEVMDHPPEKVKERKEAYYSRKGESGEEASYQQ